MSKFLVILSLLILNYVDGFTQAKDLNFDRMIISYNGDSLMKQEYELHIKLKRVYFISPFASYLHIKGEKHRTHVKLDKSKRKRVFNLVDNLTWKNIEQATSQIDSAHYYIIKTFNADKSINEYKISAESLPPDFKTLYEVVSDRK